MEPRPDVPGVSTPCPEEPLLPTSRWLALPVVVALGLSGLLAGPLGAAHADDASPLPPPVRRVLRRGEPLPDASTPPPVAAPVEEPRAAAPATPLPPARRVPGSLQPTSLARTPAAVDIASLRPLVAKLTSADFLERMRATRKLVEVGEPALPALAAAGDLAVLGPGGLSMHATRGAIEAILEDVPAERLPTWMEAPSPEVRRAAIAESARRRERRSVPELLVRLDDPAPCVRAAAVAALRQTTGQWFGFDPDGAPASRQSATARWQRWWNVQARVPAEGGPDTRR